MPVNEEVKRVWELFMLMRTLTDGKRFADNCYKEHRKVHVTMYLFDKII